tara:strand:+ start:365 stop:802 length:438 start_codon:yes stop_codon:yes gene_type:complete
MKFLIRSIVFDFGEQLSKGDREQTTQDALGLVELSISKEILNDNSKIKETLIEHLSNESGYPIMSIEYIKLINVSCKPELLKDDNFRFERNHNKNIIDVVLNNEFDPIFESELVLTVADIEEDDDELFLQFYKIPYELHNSIELA